MSAEEIAKLRELAEVFGPKAVAQHIAGIAAEAAKHPDPDVAKLGQELSQAIHPLTRTR